MSKFQEALDKGYTEKEIRDRILERDSDKIKLAIENGYSEEDIFNRYEERFGMPANIVLDGTEDEISNSSEEPYIASINNNVEPIEHTGQQREIKILKDVAEEVGVPTQGIPKSEETFGYVEGIDDYNDEERKMRREEFSNSFIGGTKRLPIGISKLLQDALNASVDLLGDNPDKEDYYYFAKEFIEENEETISKANKKLGLNGDEMFSPDNLGQLTSELATLPASALKFTKGIGWVNNWMKTRIAVGEGLRAGTTELGKTGDYKEAGKSAAIAGATTLVAGAAGERLIGMFSKGNDRLYKYMVSEHSIGKVEEDEILSNYAKTLGVDVNDLDWDDKTRALIMGSDKASGTFDYMVKNDPEIAGKINDYFSDVTNNFSKELKGKTTLDLSNTLDKVNKDISESYSQFTNIMDEHYSDIKIFTNNKRILDEVGKLSGMDISKDTLEALQRIKSGSGNITDFHKLKTMLSEKASNMFDKTSSGATSTSRGNELAGMAKEIGNLIDSKTPEILLPLKKQLDSFYKMKSTAEKAKLFSTFKDINLKESDMKVIEEAMKGIKGQSSYSKLIKMVGVGSKEAETIENAIVDSVLKSNKENGIASFIQMSKEMDSLHFKTKHGKALQEVINEYGKTFKNLEHKATQINISPDNQGLTINPLAKFAYESASSTWSGLKAIVGVTKGNKAKYIMRNLPSVLKENKMPKGLTIQEQGKVAAYSNVMSKLKRFSEQSPEQIESGLKEGYDSSFMFGQKRLGKQDFNQADIDDGVETWKKTGWYHDGVDNEWKFHIKDTDYQIKLGKGKILRGGNYKLEDVVNSKQLFENYPELKSRNIEFYNDPNVGSRGWYDPTTGEIGINSNADGFSTGSMIKDIKKTLTHEIQHSVQGIEGFASGTNPQRAGSFQKYLATHGEVESRGLTRGGVGQNPKELYDNEYNDIKLSDPFGASSVDELKNSVVNRRGRPVGSNEPEEIIR